MYGGEYGLNDSIKEPIRVMHVIESLEMGGAEKVVVDLVNHLDRKFECHIACTKHSGDMARQIRKSSVGIYEFFRGERNDYSLPCKLAKLLRDKRIKITHSHNWGTFCETSIAALMAGIPGSVHTAHGNFIKYPKSFREKTKWHARRMIEKGLSLYIDRIIAVSDDVRSGIIKHAGIPKSKIYVIRNGVEIYNCTNKYFPPEFQRSSSSEVILISVGRLVEVKNYPLLFKVIYLLTKKGLHLKTWIVGDGPEGSYLRNLVAEFGIEEKIMFAGRREDVRTILPKADIFVNTSHYEGISIAILEAMATGLPIIATDVGGNKEIVRDGYSGFLFRDGDADALAERILILASDTDLRARMGAASKRLVEEQFSIERIAMEYARHYIDILQEKIY